VSFRNIYPTPHTGPPLRAKDVKDKYGIKGDESRLKRCKFCGFICDPDRDKRVKEGSFAEKGVDYGSQQTASAYTVGSGSRKSVTDYYYTPEITGGCPACGSFRWAE
jgi:hypothetical protein